MKIVVNHVTRMAHPYACVAGIDVETGGHIHVENGDYAAASVVADVFQTRLDDGDHALLSVGLTRLRSVRDGEPARQWLQINNIHLKSTPLWIPQGLLA